MVWLNSGKFIDWSQKEKITIFPFSWLSETDCLNVVKHLGATLVFQHCASKTYPEVGFCSCLCQWYPRFYSFMYTNSKRKCS